MSEKVVDEIAQLLEVSFGAIHARAVVNHYQGAVNQFQLGAWESAIVRAGKTIEAVLKALAAHTNQQVSGGRGFKADGIIRSLEQLPQGSFDDSVRVTIPRACRFAYDVASNRGGRHDSDSINPNEMDSTVLIGTCSWIIAELLRYSQKGSLGPERVREIVSSLVTRRYPIIENVDGRLYFHARQKSARDVAVVALWTVHPKRMSKNQIDEVIRRHGFGVENARKAIQRLQGSVDDDGLGQSAPAGARPA